MIEKLKRLQAMSGAEIAHRMREQFRRETDRLRYRGRFRMDHDRDLDALIQRHGSLKTYFLNGPARRFYASTEDRDIALNFITQQFPEWFDRTMEEAAALCEHRVSLLAHEAVPLGRSIDWHRDPISGFEWPSRYWADYDLVNGARADAKVIHELNRHQHLPRLAKAFFLTNDEAYAAEAIRQIESWITQNPKWHGVNWQSSLEIAIRSISWLWTIFFLLPSQTLSEEKLRVITRSLFAQLDQVCRYPSVYTSPNTHLIGEAAALFIAGVLFPELRRAQEWQTFGANTLTSEMKSQVFSDGVYGELSTYYHCYATDFYLHAMVLARRNRVVFPDWMWRRLSRMLDFVMQVTHADGRIPLLGDDDGGRVLGLAAKNYASYRDGLCSGAILFTRPELKYQAGPFQEDSFWLLGSESWQSYDSLTSRPPLELRHAFDAAGYVVQRSGWEANDTQVTFDCGGFGIGSGGHAHADALSFTLFSQGRDILIDPGTAIYNCAPQQRRYFRSAAAHNTVMIDRGRESRQSGQSEPGDTFRWKAKAPARVRRQVVLPEIDYVDGIVEGDMTHRRQLIYVRPNYWIVLDELRGKGEHDFDFLYHFAPGAQLSVMSEEQRGEIDCRVTIEDAGLQMSMYASHPVRAEAVCGQTAPMQGWASSMYGDCHASPVLKASVRGATPVSMMSFMAPGNSPIRSRRFKANSSHAIAAAIRDGEYDDIVVNTVQDGDLRFMDFAMRGEFFFMRTEGGSLRRLFALNAYSFTYGNETLFESNEVIPYVQAYFWENGIVIERGDTLSLRERVPRGTTSD
jgi:hypothetical protein